MRLVPFTLLMTSCALGQRYTLEEPRPRSSAAAVTVRALELDLSYRNELTVRLAVSGVDGREVTLNPDLITLGEGRAPTTKLERLGETMSTLGLGVILLFPVQAAMHGAGIAAEAVDERARLRLAQGERLVVVRYPKFADEMPFELRFEQAISGGDPPPPLELLRPERPHQGLAAPVPSIGTFGVRLGGGPVWSLQNAPLGRGYVPSRGQGGVELLGGWRIGPFAVLGVTRFLGVGMLLGVELRLPGVRLPGFELTPFVGYGVNTFAADHQFFAQTGRVGIDVLFFAREADNFGFRRRMIGVGFYAHGSGQWVQGSLRPAFETGLSLNFF